MTLSHKKNLDQKERSILAPPINLFIADYWCFFFHQKRKTFEITPAAGSWLSSEETFAHECAIAAMIVQPGCLCLPLPKTGCSFSSCVT